jgi:hypothetical protein
MRSMPWLSGDPPPWKAFQPKDNKILKTGGVGLRWWPLLYPNALIFLDSVDYGLINYIDNKAFLSAFLKNTVDLKENFPPLTLPLTPHLSVVRPYPSFLSSLAWEFGQYLKMYEYDPFYSFLKVNFLI